MSLDPRHLDSTTRKRLREGSIVSLVFWLLTVVLILVRAPFWAAIVAGVAGSYFALRDWRTVRSLARINIFPPNPDADVQALIDERIDISEYRRRKENGDAV